MGERVWTQEVMMRYPKKWIVMVNVDWDGTGRNMLFGSIYAIKDTWDEAFDLKKSLEGSMEKVSIVEGYNDMPQIGGLYICNR
ncbi:MAG: hypothetical protein LBE35_08670 [Clostridiales bacterium]|jgi:hypothetical protein|nr:hypothetical protein [Clostridiales bacterium]